MKAVLISSSSPTTGTGRVAFELFRRLRSLCNVDYAYLDFGSREIQIKDGEENVTSIQMSRFPEYKYIFYYRVQQVMPTYDLYHLATQNLSFWRLSPKVVTCLDLAHVAFSENPLEQFIARFLYSGLGAADAIICISQSTKRDLVSTFDVDGDAVEVVYPGVDRSRFNTRIPMDEARRTFGLLPDHYYLLNVSSETKRKNLGNLMRALFILKRKLGLRNVKLLKAGSPEYGHDRRRLLSLVKSLGLEEDVRFLGHVHEGFLPQLYRAADMFVFPSLYEGFGLPPLEAMACGTAVVTSNVSSLPEVVGDAGLTVDPNDPYGIAETLSMLLRDESLRSSLERRADKRANSFSWEDAAKRVAGVYRRFS